MPERARRQSVASRNERLLQRIGKTAKTGAKCAQLLGVRQLHILREAESPAHECGIELVDLTVTLAAERLLIRRRLAERHVTGRPVLGNLTRVDLKGQIAIDDVIGPNC